MSNSNLSVSKSSIICGFLILIGAVLHSLSFAINYENNPYACRKIITNLEPYSCFGEVSSLSSIVFITSIILALTGLINIFKIYYSDIALRQSLVKFTIIYTPVALLISCLGLIPVEICLGFAGCGDAYFFWPLLIISIAVYIILIHLRLILPNTINKLLRFLIYFLVAFLLLLAYIFPSF